MLSRANADAANRKTLSDRPKKKPAMAPNTGCPFLRMLSASPSSDHSAGEEQQQTRADEPDDRCDPQRTGKAAAFHLQVDRARARDRAVLAVFARQLELHALEHARDVVVLGAGVGVLHARPVPRVDGDITERKPELDGTGDVAPRSVLPRGEPLLRARP